MKKLPDKAGQEAAGEEFVRKAQEAFSKEGLKHGKKLKRYLDGSDCLAIGRAMDYIDMSLGLAKK